MKQLFTFFTLFLALNTYAQATYYRTKISLINGQTKEGYAELPKNSMLSGSVRYKENQKSKDTTFKDDDIANIIYYTDQGKEFLFERLQTRIVLKSFGKWREKIPKSKSWMLVRFSDSSINLYYAASSYEIDKEGNMVSKTSDSGTWAEIPLLLKRPDEPAPTQISSITYGATIVGKQGLFRKTAAYYFEAEPELVKRIDAEEFTSDDMVALAKAYVEHKGDTAEQK